MARPAGIIKFTGTIDGISFYKSKFGWIARKKGGPDPAKMKKDKNFVRVRENGKEFGACAKAAGQVRRALMPLLKESGDPSINGKLTKVFVEIKKLDEVSVRGKRGIERGLQQEEGRVLLKGFEFNPAASVEKLLKTKYKAKLPQGTISIKGLVPAKHFKGPKKASHVRLKGVLLRFSTKKGKSEIQVSPERVLALNEVSSDVSLKVPALSLQEGISLLLLQVCFYQEINGELYALNAAEFNGMQVVEVMAGS